MPFHGCWSCGAHGPCDTVCDCAKCVDPDGYEEWKVNNPEEYDDWLSRQALDHDEECDCPSCFDDEVW
jgi:hypothetical protein